MADEYSVAWRVLDAQFWGVPQRRRRIFLVADFRGDRAGEVLFNREGLRRDFTESRKTWQGITKSIAVCPDAKCWDARGNGCGDISPNVTGDHNNRVTDYSTIVCAVDCRNGVLNENVNGTLQGKSTSGSSLNLNNTVLCCYTLDRAMFNQGRNAQFDPRVDDSGISPTVVGKGAHAVFYEYHTDKQKISSVLRRLTPTECARLQGMPDWWTDDIAIENPSEKELAHWQDVFETFRLATNPNSKPKTVNAVRKWLSNPFTDKAAYTMWGNGIALPCALYVMEGLASIDI